MAQRIPKATRDDNQIIKGLTKNTDKSGWLYYKNGLKLTHQSLLNERKNAFGLTPNDVMKIDKEQTDDLGKHFRLKQYYKGVKVEDADYVLHYDKNGNLTHSNGQLGEEIADNTNVIPSITESEALNVAVAALDGLKPIWLDPSWEQRIRTEKQDSSATYRSKGELFLVPSNNGKYDLAYVFNIGTVNPSGGWKVYINSKNRQVLKKESNLQECYPAVVTFTSLYNGTQGVFGKLANFFSSSKVLNTCNNEVSNETVDMNGSSISMKSFDWGTSKQQFTTAHWAVDQSWHYFKDKFNRSGWDGNHQKILTRVDDVNLRDISGNGGAFFDPNNQSVNLFRGFMSLDITGHEFTHGLVNGSSMIGGFGESGALNESFADIFGIMINRYVTGNLRWNIGSEAPLTQFFGTPLTFLRNLQTPANSFPAGPAILGGANWVNPTNLNNDRGGIHINCGVQNRWFNLLSIGGTQNGVTVQGIGIDKAALIAYYNMTSQLFPGAIYQDAANGAVTVAEYLYGCSSFELEQTRSAWQAVGVNPTPPQLYISGDGDVCSKGYDSQVALQGCWRFGTNYWWTVPSGFSSWTTGTGNNTLVVTIPAYYQGTINIPVYAAVNGFAPQNQTIALNVSYCGGGSSDLVVKNTNKSLISSFTLSPNPASDFANIAIPNSMSNVVLDAELYNTLGQLIYKKRITNSDSRLEIAEIPKGFYNVVLKNPSDKKIIFSNKLTKF